MTLIYFTLFNISQGCKDTPWGDMSLILAWKTMAVVPLGVFLKEN